MRYLLRCGLSTGILVGVPEASIINWAEPISSSASVSSSTGTTNDSGRMLIGFWSLGFVPGPAFCLRNWVLAVVSESMAECRRRRPSDSCCCRSRRSCWDWTTSSLKNKSSISSAPDHDPSAWARP